MDDTRNTTAPPPTRSKIYKCPQGDFLVRLSDDRCWWACINGRAYPLATVINWWTWDPGLLDPHQLVQVAEVSDAEAIAYAKRGGPYTPPPPTLDFEAMLEDRNREIRRLEQELAEVRERSRRSATEAAWRQRDAARADLAAARQQNDEMRAAHARELGILHHELRATQERLGRKEALIAQMRDLLPGRI